MPSGQWLPPGVYSNVPDLKPPPYDPEQAKQLLAEAGFPKGFRIALHEKDLRNALLAAESMKVSLPFTSLAQQILISLMNEGKGNLDHSAIVTFIEHMAGIEVKKPQA